LGKRIKGYKAWSEKKESVGPAWERGRGAADPGSSARKKKERKLKKITIVSTRSEIWRKPNHRSLQASTAKEGRSARKRLQSQGGFVDWQGEGTQSLPSCNRTGKGESIARSRRHNNNVGKRETSAEDAPASGIIGASTTPWKEKKGEQKEEKKKRLTKRTER